jgi:hypothetical protein
MKKILIFLTIFGLIIGSVKLVTKVVNAVQTTLGATITGGSLTIDNTTAATANFASKSVLSINQTTTAKIGNTNADNIGIEVSDLRGTGVGWAATMTTTNLVTMGITKNLAGSNPSAVGFTGTYTGVNALLDGHGVYTVEITTGGSVGVAIFKWTDPTGVGTTNVTTGSSVSLSNGISVTFAPATYVIGDKWSIAVDALKYNFNTDKGLTVTPSTLYAVSGTTTGLTVGGETLFTGSGTTSAPLTILTAASDYGNGDYFIDLGLSQTIHPNAYVGNYTAVATLTVS